MKPFIVSADDQVELIFKLRGMIPHGAQNAIKGKELAIQLGQYDDRKIRAAITEMIERGIPIASSVSEPFGYYICNNEFEAYDYIKVLESRKSEIEKRQRGGV